MNNSSTVTSTLSTPTTTSFVYTTSFVETPCKINGEVVVLKSLCLSRTEISLSVILIVVLAISLLVVFSMLIHRWYYDRQQNSGDPNNAILPMAIRYLSTYSQAVSDDLDRTSLPDLPNYYDLVKEPPPYELVDESNTPRLHVV